MGGINHQYIALPTTLVGLTVYDHLWTGNFLSQPTQTNIGFGTLFIQRCILIPGVYIWLGIWSHNPTCNQRLVLGRMKIITEVGSSWCYLMGRKSDTCWHVVLWRPRNRIFFRCVVPYVFPQTTAFCWWNQWVKGNNCTGSTMVQDSLRFRKVSSNIPQTTSFNRRMRGIFTTGCFTQQDLGAVWVSAQGTDHAKLKGLMRLSRSWESLA